MRRRWGVDRELVALFAGSPDPEKGLDVIIKAWAELATDTPLRLVVVGPIPSMYAQTLEIAINRLGDRLVHLDGVSHDAMPAIYRAADLVVCPSQGREALGMSNIEALASGIPVVASYRGGITEVVNEECGYLVRQYTQPQAWAKMLRQATSDAQCLRLLGARGRNQSMQFGWDRAVSQFMQVYGG